jgi:hypothetical protein
MGTYPATASDADADWGMWAGITITMGKDAK